MLKRNNKQVRLSGGGELSEQQPIENILSESEMHLSLQNEFAFEQHCISLGPNYLDLGMVLRASYKVHSQGLSKAKYLASVWLQIHHNTPEFALYGHHVMILAIVHLKNKFISVSQTNW